MPNNLPYTMDMYKEQLKKMMLNPMAMGMPNTQQPAGTSLAAKLRQAVMNSKPAMTALAGTSL